MDRRRDGKAPHMTRRENAWLETVAELQSGMDAQVRAEAREVFEAEAARTRLQERRGRGVMRLRCGVALSGVLTEPDGPDGTVSLRTADGAVVVVVQSAVVTLVGAPPTLRDETAGSRGSFAAHLRCWWASGESIRLLLTDGRWLAGVVGFVGADHVELNADDEPVVVPFGALEAWVAVA